MDLRQIRTFVTIADLGTISKAAEVLRIAQPALSRQIQNLEIELGLRLFDRVGNRLLLTGIGEQLLGECRDLLAHANAVRERARALRQEDSGVLKVAAAPGIIESVLVDFLHIYAKRYPNVQVKLVDIVGPRMLEMLEQGAIDLGQIVSREIQPDDPRFGSRLVGSLDILAACHPKLTLGISGAVDVAQLVPYPLLLHDADYTLRRAFEAACRLAGVKPNVQFEARDPRTLMALAEADHGVAIITSALRARDYALQISTVTFRGKALREPVTILWNRRRPRPRYAADFCDMLAEYVKQIFPITRPTTLKFRTAAKPAKPRTTRR